jgi:hypothetical protein
MMPDMQNDTIAVPPEVSDSAGLSRRGFFQCGVLGLFTGYFGRAKLKTNPEDATVEALDPEWLVAWRAANRIPVWESCDPKIRAIVRAVRLNQSIPIRYHGGSSPGESRVIAPSLVFGCAGFSGAWVSAYCPTRWQQRTFRLDCISLE